MVVVSLFATLAETSQRVGATSSRLGKLRELSTLLAGLAPEEIALAVHYLAGEMPQGRIGIGPANVTRAAAIEAARSATLSIAEVDRRLAALAVRARRHAARNSCMSCSHSPPRPSNACCCSCSSESCARERSRE